MRAIDGALVVVLAAGCAADRGTNATMPPVAPREPAHREASYRAESSGTLLLVSVDGLAAGDLDRLRPPNLLALAEDGVRAEGLIPVFPSKTFPNHYSIVTGLWPENHGIVSNSIHDPEIEGNFTLGDREAVGDGRWWLGEPLWVTAERQGRVAATMFWPGSEAEIGGVRPTHWRSYEHELPHADRVAQVLAWLDLPPGERPSFVTVYFSDVDSAGHRHGPISNEVASAVRRVDGSIGELLNGIEERGLADEVDVVVVSDHGMAELSHERMVVVGDHVDVDWSRAIDVSPVLGLHVGPDEAGRLARELEALDHVRAWTREDLPERFHLKRSPRTPDVVAVADDGWRLVKDKAELAFRRTLAPGGAHGYDPELPAMHGVFLARGPSFAEGLRTPAFEAVHVYELFCAVLDLEPAPNDGDPAEVEQLLRSRSRAAAPAR